MKESSIQWWSWMLIVFLLAYSLLFFTGCQLRSGQTEADGSSSYFAANVGVIEKEVAHTAEGYSAAKVDGAESFRNARLAAQSYIFTRGLVDVAGIGAKAYGANQVTKRVGLREAGETTRGAQAADVQKTAILNPAPQ